MKNVKSLLLASIMMLSLNYASAQLEWVEFDGELPSNAVIGGVETHRSLAICRCEYNGAQHPGKVVERRCNIGWGGKEVGLKRFEVLVNNGVVELDWLKTDGTEMPDHAVQAGKENGKPLYVGRAYHENGTHPGKVFRVGKNSICNIGYGGKEITYKTFEVLVENPPHEDDSRIRHDNRCDTKSKKAAYTVGQYVRTMGKERQINEGLSLVSSNIRYQTRVTDDGRMVIEEILDRALCDDGRILVFETNEIWSNTSKGGDPSLDYYLKFQEDGNLCIYSVQSGFVWCSMSNGRNGHHLELTNIGHIEIVNDHGGEVWPD